MTNALFKRLFGAKPPAATRSKPSKIETSASGRVVRQTCGWTVVEHSTFNPYDTGVYKTRQFNP